VVDLKQKTIITIIFSTKRFHRNEIVPSAAHSRFKNRSDIDCTLLAISIAPVFCFSKMEHPVLLKLGVSKGGNRPLWHTILRSKV
jgi:hypothetical protein